MIITIHRIISCSIDNLINQIESTHQAATGSSFANPEAFLAAVAAE